MDDAGGHWRARRRTAPGIRIGRPHRGVQPRKQAEHGRRARDRGRGGGQERSPGPRRAARLQPVRRGRASAGRMGRLARGKPGPARRHAASRSVRRRDHPGDQRKRRAVFRRGSCHLSVTPRGRAQGHRADHARCRGGRHSPAGAKRGSGVHRDGRVRKGRAGGSPVRRVTRSVLDASPVPLLLAH